LTCKNHLYDYYYSGPEYFPRKTEELVQHYKLDRLVKCDKLSKVIWQGKGFYRGVAKEVLEGLAEWVKEEFAKKNQEYIHEFMY
jgi:hypothetical protein